MYACVDKSQMWEHHGNESVYRESCHNASWVVRATIVIKQLTDPFLMFSENSEVKFYPEMICYKMD